MKVTTDDNMNDMNAPRWRSETVVSVVVQNDENITGRKNQFTPSLLEFIKVLSVVYAIVFTIMGIVFPVAEALRSTWLETVYNAVFLTYQLGVATAFLLYLQLYLLRIKPHKSINDPATCNDSDSRVGPGAVMNSSESFPVTVISANSQTALDPHDSESICSSTVSSVDNRGSPRISATARFRSRLQLNESLNSNGSIARRCHNTNANDVTVCHNLDDISIISEEMMQSDDEESVVWMDVAKFGNLFSHEGSSLFLRLGALIFGLGNMVYYSLEIQSNMFSAISSCNQKHRFAWTFVLRLIFVIVQTFFIFKTSKVSTTKHQSFVWFGMMHLISTNISLWIRALVREIMEEYLHDTNKSDINSTLDQPTHNYSVGSNQTFSTFLTSEPAGTPSENICDSNLLYSASKYLVPFVLEYSLIAVGSIACFLFSGQISGTDESSDVVNGLRNLIQVRSFKMADPENHLSDQEHHHQRLQQQQGHVMLLEKSHCGLFVGVLLLALSIISCTVFYFAQAQNNFNRSDVIYYAADIFIHLLLFAACILAFWLIRRLAYVPKPFTTDDMLLLIAMFGSIMYEISNIVATSNILSTGSAIDVLENSLRLTSALVALVQTAVQTILILFGMRRYPTTVEHSIHMPGRGTFTFLIVGNLSVWIMRTVLCKAVDLSTQSHFYGEVAWLLLMNINLPLLLFFRFHSSVCFADIWHVAYTPFHRKLPLVTGSYPEDGDARETRSRPANLNHGPDEKRCHSASDMPHRSHAPSFTQRRESGTEFITTWTLL